MNFNTQKQKGFTLLFAILVSTLIISIGATIISISIRQTILSSTSRESQFAFYAANTGLECAFFWDNAIMPESELGKVFPIGAETLVSNTSGIECAGGNIITGTGFTHSFRSGSWDRVGDITTFRMVLNDTSTEGIDGAENVQTCAEVTVEKNIALSGVVTTTITAKGYNTCDLTSPRAVERGLDLEYES